MYPHSSSPGSRPSAAVFGTLGDESGVDTRHAQFLIGFDTATQVATNLGATNYLLRRARLELTVSRDQSFVLDPTKDSYTTYFPTDHPDFTPDEDPGRPVELFGAGFRNGFTSETFLEDSPFGGAETGARNTYAAGYNEHGMLVDVGNNVGKTNVLYQPFEVFPFAIGTASDVGPGEPVPAGTVIALDLDLTQPQVVRYLREALDSGRLRLMVSSLHVSDFGGAPEWPDFFTDNSPLGTPPRLLLEGTAIRPDDTDGDGLPDDWEIFYWGALNEGGESDSDGDGVSNFNEFAAGTHPTEAVSHLAITGVRDESGTAILTFPYAASRQYSLEYSPDLASWRAVEDAQVLYRPDAAIAEFRTPSISSGEEPARFYRIVTR